MRRLLSLVLLGVFLAGAAQAQSIETLRKSYERLRPGPVATEGAAACAAFDASAFWSVLDAIQAEEDRQTRLAGSAQIGFNGDAAGDRELYKVNAAVNLRRGTYPTEIDVTSQVGVTLNNGTFQENVSAIRVNVDYNPQLWLETFFFLNRFSDSFMSIDQRYEVGTGLLLNGWRGLTESGQEQQKTLGAMPFDPTRAALAEAAWYGCWLALTGQTDAAAFAGVQAHTARLQTLAEEAENANQKREYRFRPALLVGVLTELETAATVSDSAIVVREDGLVKDRFSVLPGATQRFRWELRPTLDFQFSEVWRMKLRWYLKFPMPWDWYDEVALRNALGQPRVDPGTGQPLRDRRVDLRTEFQAEFSVRLTERPIFHTGQITMTLGYQRLTDNAPPRGYVPGVIGADGLPLLVHAERIHNIVRMGFGLSF